MKVIINKSEPNVKNEFPKIMISNAGRIVLFTRKMKGTTIACGDRDEIGDQSDCWDMDAFTDFDGSVTLSND